MNNLILTDWLIWWLQHVHTSHKTSENTEWVREDAEAPAWGRLQLPGNSSQGRGNRPPLQPHMPLKGSWRVQMVGLRDCAQGVLRVYGFAGAAETNTTPWETSKAETCLAVPEAGSLRSRCPQLISYWGCAEASAAGVSPHPAVMAVFGVTGFCSNTMTTALVFTKHCPWVCGCLQISYFWGHQSYWIKSSVTVNWLYISLYICKDPISKQGHIWGSEG